MRGAVRGTACREGAPLTDRQRENAIRCAVLTAGLTRTGLDALVDEATGYQYERAEDALQVKLRAFIADELRDWEKTFPDGLWEEFGRLTKRKGSLHSRPKWWGKLVIELIYDTLDADVAEYLKAPGGDDREVILVVHDEPAVRQFSVDALLELGYGVIEADGASSAMRLLQRHPEIVPLFTDVIMPDVNGRKLADATHGLRPQLKILFTTGYTRNAVVHNGVLDEGVHLIGKPFSVDQLGAKIREILDGA